MARRPELRLAAFLPLPLLFLKSQISNPVLDPAVIAMDRQKDFLARFLREQSRVYGYIVTLLPNRTNAEEVFQETALILWEKWDTFDPTREFVPWACGIAHNVARNFMRKHARGVYLDDDALAQVAAERLDRGTELNDRQGALSNCVERLQDRERTLLRQCYAEAVKIGDVAGQLGLTENALYLKLRRIRRILQDCVTRTLAAEA